MAGPALPAMSSTRACTSLATTNSRAVVASCTALTLSSKARLRSKESRWREARAASAASNCDAVADSAVWNSDASAALGSNSDEQSTADDATALGSTTSDEQSTDDATAARRERRVCETAASCGARSRSSTGRSAWCIRRQVGAQHKLRELARLDAAGRARVLTICLAGGE